MKNALSKKKQPQSAQIKRWQQRIKQLQRENTTLKNQAKRIRAQFKNTTKSQQNKLVEKAARAIIKKKYKPTKKELLVHATILLVPKRAVNV